MKENRRIHKKRMAGKTMPHGGWRQWKKIMKDLGIWQYRFKIYVNGKEVI